MREIIICENCKKLRNEYKELFNLYSDCYRKLLETEKCLNAEQNSYNKCHNELLQLKTELNELRDSLKSLIVESHYLLDMMPEI